MKTVKTWEKLAQNVILNSDDKSFYISYNPDTATSPINQFATLMGKRLGGKNLDSVEETALVLRGDPHTYCILNGDFRQNYEKLIDKGWDECYKFFKKKLKNHGNGWSTREEDRI